MEYHHSSVHLFFEVHKTCTLNHSQKNPTMTTSCVLLMILPGACVWLHQRVHEPQSLVQVRQQKCPPWQDALPQSQLTCKRPLTPARALAARQWLYFLCSVNKVKLYGLLAHTGMPFRKASSISLLPAMGFCLRHCMSYLTVFGDISFSIPAFANTFLGICLRRRCFRQFLSKLLNITFKSSHMVWK